ncbi:NADPH-dependent alkenal/one oxidoreductase [Vanrija pseudolonga]|uniref:NADPH-dependent alkenal/one oxidoreductase, chloroplastic n=1 Tax=Vanrija pseudolonga TaxID=143232 RepID=A0AAF0YD42_9TREE|nr:NADPH-dependent alkenal/one oxidoreductase, chloroplastic [Vanrija pseudolonga]
MSKPTFLQSVLGRPSRSYADFAHADDRSLNRKASSSSFASSGYGADRRFYAAPSASASPPQRPRSTASFSQRDSAYDHVDAVERSSDVGAPRPPAFPASIHERRARRVTSDNALRYSAPPPPRHIAFAEEDEYDDDGGIDRGHRDARVEPPRQRRTRTTAANGHVHDLPRHEPERVQRVREAVHAEAEEEEEFEPVHDATPGFDSVERLAPGTGSDLSAVSASSGSAPSSLIVSPQVSTTPGLLFKPNDAAHAVSKPAVPAPPRATTLPVPPVDDSESEDSDNEQFYTPSSSFISLSETAHDDTEAEETPQVTVSALPILRLQPPTPAPIPDPVTSPLDSALASDDSPTTPRAFLAPGDADRIPLRLEPLDEELDEVPELVEPLKVRRKKSSKKTVDTPPKVKKVVAPEIDTPTAKPKKVPVLNIGASPSKVKKAEAELETPPPLPPKPASNAHGRVRGAEIVILGGNDRPSRPTLQRSSSSASTARPRSQSAFNLDEVAAAAPTLTRSKSTKSVKSIKSVKSVKSLREKPSVKALSDVGRATPTRATPSPPASVIAALASGHGRRISHDSRDSASIAASDISRPPSVIRPDNGAVGVRAAGYGKGGWAAASAAPVVMYMPKEGDDGWAAFQPLPPRSRFAPMPGAPSSAQHDGPHGSTDGSRYSGYTPSWASSASQPVSVPSQTSVAPSTGSGESGGYSSRRPSSEIGGHAPVVVVPAPAPPAPAPSKLRDPVPDSDSESEEELEAPSRSYAHPAQTATPPPLIQPPLARVPVAEPVYDYASEAGTPAGGSRAPSEVGSGSYNGTAWNGRLITPDPYDIPRSRTMSMAGSVTSSSPHRTSFTPRLPASPLGQEETHYNRFSVDDQTHYNRFSSLAQPSTLNPDAITFLPVMTSEDSDRLYVPSEPGDAGVRRASSVWSLPRLARSQSGRARSDVGQGRASSDLGTSSLRRKSMNGQRIQLSSRGEGSVAGDVPLMESHGRDQTRVNGYTNLILPTGGGFTDSHARRSSDIDSRVLGLPHAAMAAITLSTAPPTNQKDATPMHLRHHLPAPVDFTSHIKPPGKVHPSQILVQIYAVAIDHVDILALDDKTRADVGKWIPGRSFVGRCISAGEHEKDIHRGDIIVGLVDIKKSGALCEYVIVERRRVARLMHSNHLSLEQLAALPIQGISAHRALRGILRHGQHALVMDAHTGVPALICQEMARHGVAVTAVISGGEDHGREQAACLQHGARGVLTGSPATVMNRLEESSFDIVVDSRGGAVVYEAARRVLVDGGRIISLASAEPSSAAIAAPPRQASGLANIKAAFSKSKRGQKHIKYTYVPPAGTGEPEVDTSGLDTRDVLEEPVMAVLHPVVRHTVPFERGAEVFRWSSDGIDRLGVSAVRLIN